MTTDPGSITRSISMLRAGSSDAAEELWRRYFTRLSQVAATHLQGSMSVADGEDIALSVFDAVFRHVSTGRLPRLADRHDLWGLLLIITRQKAINRLRAEAAQKRRGRREANATPYGDADETVSLQQLASTEPTPYELAMLKDQFRYLMEHLASDELRHIAQAKLEGFTSQEIAQRLGVASRTVDRKLNLIRLQWIAAAER